MMLSIERSRTFASQFAMRPQLRLIQGGLA
jgi:hypothetical protein